MKIRNGFVSNSSSSSFIVHIKKEPKCPHCGRGDIDLTEVISQSEDYGPTYMETMTKEATIKRIKEWVDDYDEEDKTRIKQYTNKVKAIKDKGQFAYIRVDNCDNVTSELIKNSPNITIIYGDNT